MLNFLNLFLIIGFIEFEIELFNEWDSEMPGLNLSKLPELIDSRFLGSESFNELIDSRFLATEPL